MPTLDREIATFAKHRDELLADSEGRWVLIHGDTVVGVYDTDRDAFEQGVAKFGIKPFFIKQIVRIETPGMVINCVL